MDPGVRETPYQVKRRKLRKGTRSCWECKGRKVKCTYMTPEDSICDGCVRRGTNCVSQELPEQPLGQIDRRRQIGNRMVRVESIIEKLVKGANGNTPPSDLTSSNGDVHLNTETLTPPSFTTNISEVANSEYEKISEALLASYPSQEGIDNIAKIAGPIPSFFHQLLIRKDYKDMIIDENEKKQQLAELVVRHPSKMHPVIIARQMLLLAISFRYIHPSAHDELRGYFHEPPSIAMERFVETAFALTADDSMMDSLEGIECLLLAASFHADSGNLRAAWSIIRRAMLTAQLMCLHRQKRPPLKTIQSKIEWNHQLLWYKIIYYDRFFSLILGLPQGSMDNSMGAPSALVNDTPMGRLERRHCVLASRILQRNDTDFNTPDELDTLAIDKELRQLAESMPSKWWLIPNLAYMKDSDDLFWTTVRLTNQVFHYILLSHLHLPYLLHSGDHEYSRVACVNASRDMLHRYMGFRTFNSVLYCCHSMDFFAITASMTLILAHLSQSGSGSALVHQRTSDRALMEEILDNMEQVGTLSKVISISERGAGVLRRLLVIEADAASGSRYRLEAGETNDTRALRLNFPYFGTITITQYTPEVSERPLGPERTAEEAPSGNLPDLSAGGMSSLTTNYVNAASATAQPNGAVDTGSGGLSFGESLGQEDWEFQDANMSFFDALMKESDAQMDYWWLQ